MESGEEKIKVRFVFAIENRTENIKGDKSNPEKWTAKAPGCPEAWKRADPKRDVRRDPKIGSVEKKPQPNRNRASDQQHEIREDDRRRTPIIVGEGRDRCQQEAVVA